MAAPSVALNQTRFPEAHEDVMTNPQLNSANNPVTLQLSGGFSGLQDNLVGFDHTGARQAFDSSADFTARRYLCFQSRYTQFDQANRYQDTLANSGLSILFFDASNNYKEYNWNGNDFPNNVEAEGGWVSFRGRGGLGTAFVVIDLNATADNVSGTLDDTAVTGFEVHYHSDSTINNADVYIASMFLADDDVITAGENGDKGTFQTISDAVTAEDSGWEIEASWRLPSGDFNGSIGPVYSPRKGFAIGDGSTLTEFEDTAGSSIFYYPSQGSGQELLAHVITDNGDRGCTINQSASDIVEITGAIWSSSNIVGGDCFFAVQGSSSGTCTITNNTFFFHTYVTVAHATMAGCVFDDCDQIEINADSAMTGCVIRNNAQKGLYLQSAAGDYTDIDVFFEDTNTLYDITINPPGTGTWDLEGISVQSGHTIVIRNDHASTAITVNIPAGVSFSTSTAGGTVTVTQPSVTFTINSSASSSLIQIFTTATQTVLASTTGTSLAFAHAGQTIDYVVQKAGFLPQRFVGTVLSGTSSVTVNLTSDPVYDSGHGLTYTTDAEWSRANNELTVPTFGPSVRAVHSLMIDSFIAESTLENTAYNIQMNGPNALFLVQDAEGATDGDIENMTAGGVRYVTSVPATAAEWVGVESIGTATGFQGEYQLGTAGSNTTDARALANFDELLKSFGDSGHGSFDFRSDLVLKYQPNGFRESRVDVLDVYGISTLEPTLYLVAMAPVAITAAIGDPAISITIVDHTGAPLSVGGKDFDFEIQDNGTNTAEDILRELNFNLSLDATYEGRDPFNWPEMVKELGTGHDTLRGIIEGLSGTHGIYVSRTAADHPNFTRFQSNDGTFHTPATVAAISAPNLSGGRVQIVNETGRTAATWAATTAYIVGDKVLRVLGEGTEAGVGLYMQCTIAGTSGGSEPTWDTTPSNTTVDATVTWTTRAIEFDNAVVTSGYSNSWTNGEDFDAGDTIRLRWVDKTQELIQSSGVATVAGTTTFLDTPVLDDVYDVYGIDGSTVTEFSADYPNLEVDVDDTDDTWFAERLYSWFKFNLTLADGIRNFWDGLTALDPANLRINDDVVDIFLDNIRVNTAKQGDLVRLFRTDGVLPVVNPTSGGGGFSFFGTGTIYTIETGISGVTAQDLTDFKNEVFNEVMENSETFKEQIRLMRAEAAGKVAVSGNTVSFRDAGDTKDRITATTDSNGQRTSVTTDGT